MDLEFDATDYMQNNLYCLFIDDVFVIFYVMLLW